MSAYKDEDPRIHGIRTKIRVVPNFPQPGIMFQDITTLLLDPKAFKDTIDLFVERFKGKNISVVAGIEARGFIFGPPIALAIGAKFVPLRKPRKLPGEVISEKYTLEYGSDCLEMHVGAVKPHERALVVDDLIATGGTLCAAMNLLGSGAVEREAIVRASRVPLTRANVTKTNHHHPFQPLPHIQERKEKTGESVQMPFSLTNDLVVSLGRSLTPFNSEKGYSDRYACS
ncbi:adenine phosphoribosyltransferase 3-like isoform X1 [Cucurbita pepo subsp. pepo]|uniref:adenine phosphoribosyltransferase 3-like isoform X1 n=1 Tax=Cucurbita pepo subsp. pepo TaxID=3664 RepID=UPI000C9DA093|nr:adenine phosphoribosyltransferase 3-like isoform X1 [Cucurbita pepo subsp. pepo]